MRVPRWVWWGAGIAVLVALLGGLGYLTYGALDRLYPQGLWRYFRPVPGPASGSILYRHVDGYLLLAPVADPGQAQRLSPEAPEIVRDAVFLSDGKAVAYIATDRRSGQPETEHLKVVGLDGAVRHDAGPGRSGGGAPAAHALRLAQRPVPGPHQP